MKKLILFSSLFLFACSSPEKTDSVEEKLKKLVEQESMVDVIEDVEPDLIPSNPPVFAKNGVDFGFAGYLVSIDETGYEREIDNIIPPRNDTCFYDLDLGEGINDTKFRISPMGRKDFVKFDVYQRDLFNFSISNEGPHCDLIEMEPYCSEWIELDVIKPNYSFQTLAWGDAKMPHIDISDSEFKILVKEHCGEDYANLLGSEYISASCKDHIGTSGHQFKIVATFLDGSIHTSYIQLSSPMGC